MLIVNSVGVKNNSRDSANMINDLCEQCRSITLPKFPSVSLDVWIINIYSSFRGPT